MNELLMVSKREEIHGWILTLLVKVATRELNGFEATDQILSYLHEQDVVIKTDKIWHGLNDTFASYTVEPLIEESDSE